MNTNRNGMGTTTTDEQIAQGHQAGLDELAKNLDADAIARRVKFDRQMAVERGPVFGAFHAARADVLEGKA